MFCCSNAVLFKYPSLPKGVWPKVLFEAYLWQGWQQCTVENFLPYEPDHNVQLFVMKLATVFCLFMGLAVVFNHFLRILAALFVPNVFLTCAIFWLKTVLHEEKRRTGSGSGRTNATKTVSGVFRHWSRTGKSYSRTRSDVGSERVKCTSCVHFKLGMCSQFLLCRAVKLLNTWSAWVPQ